MNRKRARQAFTIVELLGVIVILSILALLVVPNVIKYMQEGKDSYEEKLRDQLIIAGKNYYSENKENLPIKKGEAKIITVKEMQSLGLISKNFVDSDGNDCSDSKVQVTNTGTEVKFSYTGCLVCTGNNKLQEGDKCEGQGLSAEERYKDLCELTVDNSTVDNSTVDNSSNVTFKNISKYDNDENISVKSYVINEDSAYDLEEDGIPEKKVSSKYSNPGDILYGHVIYESYEDTETSEIESEGQEETEQTNSDADKYKVSTCKYVDPRIQCEFQNKPEKISEPTTIELVCKGNNIKKEETTTSNDRITLSTNEYGRIEEEIKDVTSDEDNDVGRIRNFEITFVPEDDTKGEVTITAQGGFLKNTTNKSSPQDQFTVEVNTALPDAKITVKGEKEAGGYLSPSVTTTRTCTSKNKISSFICKPDGTSKACGTYSTSTDTKKVAKITTTESTHSKGKTFSVECKNSEGSHTVSKKVKIDAGDPKISMSTNKSKVSGAKWYKVSSSNKLKITFTCSDSLSGMKSIVVKTQTTGKIAEDTTTVTKEIGGAHKPIKFTVTCKDKVGNKSTKDYSFYTRIYTSSCSECGVKSYKKCKTSACGCQTYNRCSSCACKTYSSWRTSTSTESGTCGYQAHPNYGNKKAGSCPCSASSGTYKIVTCSGSTKVTCGKCGCNAGGSGGGWLGYYYTCKKTTKTRSCKTRKRCSLCSCATYKKCAAKACGVDVCNSCWHY